MPSSEASISKACIEILEWNKCMCFRQNAGSWQNQKTGSWIVGAIAGTTDWIVAMPRDGIPMIGFLEIKRVGAKLSIEQISFLRMIESKKWPWCVATDSKHAEQWFNDPWGFKGDPKNVALVLDESRKFVPAYDGRRHRKTEKMSWEVMAQIDRWKK